MWSQITFQGRGLSHRRCPIVSYAPGPWLKRGKLTYLVVMVEVQPYQVVVDVLDVILDLLDEFSDFMRAILPDGLPPMRLVEHCIELVLGAKSLGKAPYKRLTKGFGELKIQVGELLESEKIQLSKALFGGLIFFRKKINGTLCLC